MSLQPDIPEEGSDNTAKQSGKHRFKSKGAHNKGRSGRRRSSLYMAVRSNEGGEKTAALTPQQWDTVNSLPQFCLPDYRIVSIDPLPRPRYGHHVSTDSTGTRLYATYVALSSVTQNEIGEDIALNFVVVLLSGCIAFKSQLRFLRCFSNHVSSLNLIDCWREEVLQFAIYATRCPLPPANLLIKYPLYNQTIAVTSPIPLSNSYAELPTWCVLHFLDHESLCLMLSAFLNERSMVVLSSSTSVIPQFIASLLVTLFPLRYCHTVIPVLPDDMLGFLDAPSVFIIGCHSKHLATVKSIPELLVVDLDAGKAYPTQDLKLNPLPTALSNIIVASHRRLVARAVILQMAQEHTEDELEFRLIQTTIHLFQKLLDKLLWDVVNWVDHQQRTFNEVQFLEEVTNKAELPFFAEFARTNLVEDLVQRLLVDPELVDNFLAAADDSSFETIDGFDDLPPPPVYHMPSLSTFTTAAYFDKCASELMRSFSSTPDNQSDPQALTHAQILMLATTLYALDEQWTEAARVYYTLANVQAELFSTALFRDFIFPHLTDEQIQGLGVELRKVVTEMQQNSGESISASGKRRQSRAPIPVKYITANLPTGPLGFSLFKKTVANFGIANFHSNALKLFSILCGKSGSALKKQTIPATVFSKFYDFWKEADQNRDLDQRPNLTAELLDNEEVLKISNILCKTSGPPGWLILTTERLLVAPSAVGRPAFCAFSFSDVMNIEFVDESRLKPAIVKIMLSIPKTIEGENEDDTIDGNALTISRRHQNSGFRGKSGRRTALSIANTFSIQTFTFEMNFEREETFVWYKIIREVNAGHKLASGHKFNELKLAAFESVKLLDALLTMYSGQISMVIQAITGFTRLTQTEKDRGDLDPFARMTLVRKLSPGANFKISSMTSCLSTSHGGSKDTLLLLGCEDGTLHIYSRQADWKWVRKLNFGGAPITALCAANNSGQLWMGRGDGYMLVGDINNKLDGRRQLAVHASAVSSLSLSLNESVVCSISSAHEVVFISAPTLAVLSRIAGMSSILPMTPVQGALEIPGGSTDARISGASVSTVASTVSAFDQPARMLRKLEFLRSKPIDDGFIILLHDELFRISASGDRTSQKINLKQLSSESAAFMFDIHYAARKIVVIGRLQMSEGGRPSKAKRSNSRDESDVPSCPSPVFLFDVDSLQLVEEVQFETQGELVAGAIIVEQGEMPEHKAEMWVSRGDGQVDIFNLYPVEKTALPGIDTRHCERSLMFYQKAMIRNMFLMNMPHTSGRGETESSLDPNKIVACLAKTLDLHVVALWKADSMVSIV